MSTPTAEAKQDISHKASVERHHEVCKPGSIFVSIAAYRDPECQWTMRDLFRQAEEAELVTVGVVWQIDAVADAAFVRVAGNTQRHRQVRSFLLCKMLKHIMSTQMLWCSPVWPHEHSKGNVFVF